MLKRGLLFLLVSVIFLQSALAQEACLLANEENVPIVAQDTLSTFSRMPHLDGDKVKIVEASLDGLRVWQPGEGIDPNWVDYKPQIEEQIILKAVEDDPFYIDWLNYFYSDDISEIEAQFRYFLDRRINGEMSFEEVQFRERISQNLDPYGYDPVSLLSNYLYFIEDDRNYRKERVDGEPKRKQIRIDLFRIYLGLTPYYDYLKPSIYRPSEGEALPQIYDVNYYQFDASEIVEDFKDHENLKSLRNFDDFRVRIEELILRGEWFNYEGSTEIVNIPGSYFRNLGVHEVRFEFDEGRGERYMSYWDYWDLDPPIINLMGLDVNEFNFPFVIYGRLYESELEEIYV